MTFSVLNLSLLCWRILTYNRLLPTVPTVITYLLVCPKNTARAPSRVGGGEGYGHRASDSESIHKLTLPY